MFLLILSGFEANAIHPAYAVYFDYRRRSHADFRRNLRRNEREQERAEKDAANANAVEQRQAIKLAVDQAKEEGFPTNSEEKEAYFLEQVQNGEVLSADRKAPPRALDVLGSHGQKC